MPPDEKKMRHHFILTTTQTALSGHRCLLTVTVPPPFHFTVLLSRGRGQSTKLKEPSGLTYNIRTHFLPSQAASQCSRLVCVEWVWRGRVTASAV